MKIGSLFDGNGEAIDWRPIQGHKTYFVNQIGEVYSKRSNKKLKPSKDKYGYLYYVISENYERTTMKAHRIVAQAFIENPLNKPTVNHKNGNRSDNRVENLEWATHREQLTDVRTYQNIMARAAKTDYRAMGEKRNFGRRKTAVYREGELLDVYESLRTATKAYGANYSKASMCANGQRKTAGGLVFCFV